MLLERGPVLASLRQYAHEAGQGEGATRPDRR